jgi:3'(2'), 5'-bisphosphate nucleotidase
MEWDTAAGQAIVEQAGGSVLQYGTGEPLRYNKENLLNPWFIVRRSLQSDILQKQREG